MYNVGRYKFDCVVCTKSIWSDPVELVDLDDPRHYLASEVYGLLTTGARINGASICVGCGLNIGLFRVRVLRDVRANGRVETRT